MNDSMINWQGSGNLNINSPWSTEEPSPAQKKAALEQIKDSLSTSQGGTAGRINGKTYVSPSETPTLKTPQSDGNEKNLGTSTFGLETLFDIKGKGFDKVMVQLQNMANVLGSSLKEEAEGGNPLASSVNSQIENLSDAELKKLAPNLNPQQAKALLSFASAQMGDIPPKVLSVLSQLPSETLKTLATLPAETLKALASLPSETIETLKNLTPEALASGNGVPKELAALLKGLPTGVLAALQSLPKEAFSPLQSVSPQTLSALASLPPQVAAKAASLVQNGEAATNTKFNSDTAVLLDQAGAQIQKGAFALAMDNAGLSKDEKNVMSLANEIPQLAEALPPAQKQLLASLKEEAFKSTGADYGIPADWNSAGRSQMALESGGFSFDTSVGQALESLLDDQKISVGEYNQMRTDYFVYNGEGTVKDVVAELQKSSGLPSDFSFPVMSESYHKILDGAVFMSFQDQMGAVSPPLSGDEKQQLTTALSSPEGAKSLPENLQPIFAKVKASAINAVSEEYGLKAGWQPQIESMITAVINMISPEYKAQLAAFNQAKEMQQLTTSLNSEIVKSTGPTPTSISIASYMTAVSSALLGLQEQLYSSAVTDAAATKRLSQVQADTNTTKLKKQREDLDEILEKKKKMAGLGAAFQWIIMIFLLAFLLPLFIAMTAMMVAGAANGKGLSGTKGPLDVAAEGVGLPVKAFFMMLMVLCPALMLLMTLIDLMFTGGKGLLEPMLKSFGVPPSVISKVLMALQMVTIVAMVVVMVILTLTPGGQAIAAEMAEAMAGTISGMESGAATVATAVGAAAGAAGAAVAALGPVGQAAVAAATMIAEAVAFAAQLGATLMKMFASLVGSLLDSLYTAVGSIVNTVGEAAKAIGQALANIASNASSKITTGVNAAIQRAGLEGVKKTITDTLTRLLENVQKLLEKAVQKLGLDDNPAIDAAKRQFTSSQNSTTSLEEQLKDLQGMLSDLKQAKDPGMERNIKIIESKISQTQNKITTAREVVEINKANFIAAQKEAATLASNTVSQIETIVSSVTGTMQSGITINNQILEGQIALIKGALEAYKAETDAMLKLVGKVLNNMQNQLQDIASWIKGVTDLQQEMMKKMSIAVSRITSV